MQSQCPGVLLAHAHMQQGKVSWFLGTSCLATCMLPGEATSMFHYCLDSVGRIGGIGRLAGVSTLHVAAHFGNRKETQTP